MKSMFHPKRFIHVALGLAALAFPRCSKQPGAPAALSGEGASPTFQAVASRLELGARSFEYSEADAAPALAKFLDEIVKALPARERRDIPLGFFAKLSELLGIDAIAATGSSTRARGDGSFHSRSFALTPKGRKGLLTLSGGPAAKLMLLDLAPKDTDFALEFPICTKDFARDAWPQILAMIPPRERAEIERDMSQPIPGLGLSGRQILEKLDARVGIYLRLDPSQKFQPAPDAPQFPGADGVIVIERIGWLVEALKPQFMPQLKEPGAPVSVTDEGGVLTVRFTSPTGPPPMDFQPVARFDSKADRIIIASRPALFDSVVAGKEKITQGADFTQAWRDLPSEGNACIYASPRLLQTVGDLVAKAAMSERGGSAADRAVFQKISDWVKPLLSHGQALVVANQPDGILAVSNASVPLGTSSMAAVSAVAVLSSLAMPAYSSARMRAVEASDMNNIRQVQMALRMYYTDCGKYPAALSGLTGDNPRQLKYIENLGILEFTDRRSGQRIPWMYRSSLTENSPANEVLIAAPVAEANGMRIVGFNDGSVRSIPEGEFQALWSKK